MSEELLRDSRISPKEVLVQFNAAINRHDVEGVVGCFAPNYQSEQPFHPERAFTGSDVVRKNYEFLFTNIPDIHGDILNLVVDGENVWIEQHLQGTKLDGTRFILKGVILAVVQSGVISSARLYMEQIQEPPQA